MDSGQRIHEIQDIQIGKTIILKPVARIAQFFYPSQSIQYPTIYPLDATLIANVR